MNFRPFGVSHSPGPNQNYKPGRPGVSSGRVWLVGWGMDNEEQKRDGRDDEYTPEELGGAIHLTGKGYRRYGVVHFGPEDGVCSVAPEGCGYCIGRPCELPRKPRARKK